MVFGLLMARPLLTLMGTDASVLDQAVPYMCAYFCGMPANMLYNYCASMLRSSGDTTRPLIYMLLSGSLNLVMNIILCFVLKEKVAAVAIATLASQVLGAVLTMVRLCTMKGDCRISLLKMRFSVPLFRRILRFGLPICLNTALFPIANLQIQSAINSFGSAATAGNVASINLENFVSSVTTAFGTSALTFIGQNLGAGKPDRVRKSFRLCLSISFLCGLVLGLLLYSFGDFFLSFFVGNDYDAIGYGMIRARYILVFHCIAALNSGFGATLNAFGYSAFTSLVSIIAVFGLRLVWMNFIYPFFPSFECVFVCFFVSWLLMLICNIIMIAIVFRKYKKGTIHALS
jgi:putative MATE family efflux protein